MLILSLLDSVRFAIEGDCGGRGPRRVLTVLSGSVQEGAPNRCLPPPAPHVTHHGLVPCVRHSPEISRPAAGLGASRVLAAL